MSPNLEVEILTVLRELIHLVLWPCFTLDRATAPSGLATCPVPHHITVASLERGRVHGKFDGDGDLLEGYCCHPRATLTAVRIH